MPKIAIHTITTGFIPDSPARLEQEWRVIKRFPSGTWKSPTPSMFWKTDRQRLHDRFNPWEVEAGYVN